MHLKFLNSYLCFSILIPLAYANSEHSKSHHANHIFNAIHSSMRQWGSSLNHNGMSFFLASVPAGTKLYHGTSREEAVEGTEWLAFEPEHALIFARPRGPRGPPPGEGDGEKPPNGPPPMDGEHLMEEYLGPEWEHLDPLPSKHEPGNGLTRRPPPAHHQDGKLGKPLRPFDPERHGEVLPPHRPHDLPPPPSGEHRNGPPEHHEPLPPHHPHDPPPPPPPPRKQPQPPGRHDPPPPPEHHDPPPSRPHHERRRDVQQPLSFHIVDEDIPHGYLHTYVPKHALRLLYIDGLSAGKTSNGTLDTQDMLILNHTDTGGPMGGEMDRARGMCNLTTTLWAGKIDGILRMEGGFEIILCDFEAHVERTEIIAVTRASPGFFFGGWQYIKAITSRYHGIGGNRVSLDYDNFVSVFDYPDIENLFTNDVISDYAMPRLQNVKDADRLRVKDDVTKMILDKDWDEKNEVTDWQAVADNVVQRYSKSLHYLHTNEKVRTDKELLAAYISTLLRPFIDSTARNATLETQRCIAQFVEPLPHTPEPAAPLAHRTLFTVTRHICDTLLTSLSIASSPTPHSSFTSVYASHATELIDQLYEYLRWTTWKECRTCEDEEVCFIPIWPMGSHEDHAKPRCLDNAGANGRIGYWGSRWGGPPPGKGGEERGKDGESEGRGGGWRE